MTSLHTVDEMRSLISAILGEETREPCTCCHPYPFSALRGQDIDAIIERRLQTALIAGIQTDELESRFRELRITRVQ